VLQIPGLR